jgi:hypothetical protein
MFGHRRHDFIFLTRLFLFIGGMPTWERDYNQAMQVVTAYINARAAADAGAV